jgi:hypothetical protein
MRLPAHRVWRGVSVVLLSVGIAVAQQAPVSPAKKCAEPQVTQDSKFRPGQVWAYQTREGEESSTITILRVESLPKIGVIVHVRLDGIRLKNCSGGPSPTSIGHAPFAKDALDRSVTKLVEKRRALPEYEEGYNNWRQACGGVYTITVAEMLKADEMTFNSGMSCSSR